MKHIVTIVGARPQFIKAAVLSRLLRSSPWKERFTEVLVHTGQHYDENMSEVFFREMDIPEADINLNVGSGAHGKMTGEMLARIEEALLAHKPDLVLVYGDTNSTLAGALAAGKLCIPLAHVEAGLRSYHKAMPEEQNRIVADHLSDWLFCPTDVARRNLEREGITRGVHIVGDIMLDASLHYRQLAAQRPSRLNLPSEFYLLTIHRAENTDSPARLAAIVDALNRVELSAIFPVHPRTRKMLAAHGLVFAPHIRLMEPVGYLDMIELESKAKFIVTDSGGVQKEAYFFRKPCVTLREQTEWVETVESGWNRLAGANAEEILRAMASVTTSPSHPSFYGEGDCAARILKLLE